MEEAEKRSDLNPLEPFEPSDSSAKGDSSPTADMASSDPSSQSSFEVITETEKDALQVEMLQTVDNLTSSQEPERLCGYLQKQGARGLVKQYKIRWFVYGDTNCKLYYYRTPQDVLPLGEIDVSNATLSFEVGTNEKPGLFLIR